MKKYLLCILFVVAFSLLTFSQNLTAGAAFLFENVKTKLTVEEKNRIFALTTLTLVHDTVFYYNGDPMEQVNVYPVDLNKDGIEEIVVTYAGKMFGLANYMYQIYSKKAGGNYAKCSVDLLGNAYFTPTKTLGYPDMIEGGPGLEYPLYKWNGKEYVQAQKLTNDGFAKIKTTNLEDLSKKYTAGLK